MGLDLEQTEGFLKEIKGTILETIIESYIRINPNLFKAADYQNEENEIVIDKLNNYEKKFFIMLVDIDQKCELVKYHANRKNAKTDSKFESSLIFSEADRKIKELTDIRDILEGIIWQSINERHPCLKNGDIRYDFKIVDTEEAKDEIYTPINVKKIIHIVSNTVN